ncbi:proline dehydrogenase [Aquibacillus rhizosphaerae]|uniref:proline dehydrogenase n=1 Tax=Aquibacillus rhizosphaerae TaxID=3051431 RepID=A0ABT7LF77_9BACI|nr:proline dehydrogenase [Aquibacillus sp. LR5S19]MDL4843216.1 proline dehydrogenase [Aquibacillus sp. LR5S19]
MESIMRNFFLFLGKSKAVNTFAKKFGHKLGASKFVAGETLQHAIETASRLNKDGRVVTLDHLGEFVSTQQDANASAQMILKTLDAIHDSQVESHLSLKMTSLGLDIHKDVCLKHMYDILERAKKYNIFVRIDMEDFAHCQVTLDIFKELLTHYDNVGSVIQAYLYRAEDDIKELDAYHPNLRLVKGAYKESDKVAFPDKQDVDTNFNKIIKLHLQNGNYTAIATHDEKVIQQAKQYVDEKNISSDQFEFQLLYGICEDLQKQLVKEGFKVRVYVPFGVDWFGYFMRRLAERPANVWFVLKNMFK